MLSSRRKLQFYLVYSSRLPLKLHQIIMYFHRNGTLDKVFYGLAFRTNRMANLALLGQVPINTQTNRNPINLQYELAKS